MVFLTQEVSPEGKKVTLYVLISMYSICVFVNDT